MVGVLSKILICMCVCGGGGGGGDIGSKCRQSRYRGWARDSDVLPPALSARTDQKQMCPNCNSTMY